MLLPVFLAVGAWESAWWAAQKAERRTAYAAAFAEARRRRKPLRAIPLARGPNSTASPIACFS